MCALRPGEDSPLAASTKVGLEAIQEMAKKQEEMLLREEVLKLEQQQQEQQQRQQQPLKIGKFPLDLNATPQKSDSNVETVGGEEGGGGLKRVGSFRLEWTLNL